MSRQHQSSNRDSCFSCSEYSSGRKGLPPESPLPWISGWDLSGQATNVRALLTTKAQLGYKGAYLILCATWEAKCTETLKFINRQRGQLIESEINVIAIFTENISTQIFIQVAC